MPRRRPLRLALLTVAVLAAACADGKKAPADSTAAMTPAKPDSGAAMAATPAATGDPDHDFLRAMTDHHKGLITMAHETIESTDPTLTVKALAKRLDSEQDAEMDKMSTMLEQTFKDPYAPKITAANQTLVDALKGKTGADYDHVFLTNVIAHHQESVAMIDAYLATAKDSTVKAMAETMKATKTKEIAELQKRLAK
jgi:uncharacterized protein (DUF305 family)